MKKIRIAWNKGKHFKFSKEHKINIGKAHCGRKFSEEHKRKIGEKIKSLWEKGLIKPNRGAFKKGNILSDEVRKKLSDALKGDKSSAWKGGIAHLPYSVDWTQTLKRSIRERDKYTCKICGKPQENKAHPVHHIDYDKKNCNPDNLITLCINCHAKTNSRRSYWIDFFQAKLPKPPAKIKGRLIHLKINVWKKRI